MRLKASLPLPPAPPVAGDRQSYLAQQTEALRQAGATVEAVGDVADVRPPYEQILEACHKTQCDLIVVPAPYREDFAVLGSESIGSNLDILLCRVPETLLVAREPKVEVEGCLAHILLPVTLS